MSFSYDAMVELCTDNSLHVSKSSIFLASCILAHEDHLYLVPTLTTSFGVSAVIVTILIHSWCYIIELSISHRYKELIMDWNHSSVSHTGSFMKYMTPNFTQLRAWQRFPALIVLKEEKTITTTPPDCTDGAIMVYIVNCLCMRNASPKNRSKFNEI